MDEFRIRLFEGEIETQCEFVILAAQRVAQLFGQSGPNSATVIWCELQTILVSAANISKLLWGSRKPDAPGRAPLREKLAVQDDSPIRTKRVRNAFEHFDEFIEKMPTNIYVGRNIGPPGMFTIGGEAAATRFGHFDPVTGEVTFWDRTINVKEVVREVERIYGVIRAQHG